MGKRTLLRVNCFNLVSSARTELANLECPPQPEYTIVSFLWWESFESKENGLGFFRNQVVGSAIEISISPAQPQTDFDL